MEHFRLALVTGATSGIGKALSQLLASKKIALILSGRNEESLAALKNELSKKVPVTTLIANISSDHDRKMIVQTIEKKIPDLVINNAGFGLYGDALSHPVIDQLDILDVNGTAVLEFTLTAAKALKEAKRKGVILNISSAAAFQVFPGFAVYAASKTLVNSFSEALDWELKKEGIRVLSACPGFVETSFGRRAAGGRPPAGVRKLNSMTPEFAAQEIWQQIVKQKPVHIFDWRFRVATWLSRLVPKRILKEIIYQDILDRVK